MRLQAEFMVRLEHAAPGGILADEVSRRAYEQDAFTARSQMPLLVVLPSSVEEVSAVLRVCSEFGVKVVPRGAGTSLSGGALPVADGIVLGLAKLNHILDIDYENRTVTCQPGVTNLAISNAVAARGFYYAPDPSSQIACTIGGNVAENSGGVHCLKYGITTNNVLGTEIVTITGEVLRLGGKHLDAEGYDLLGILTGSEGLLGVVTEVTVRIQARPQTARALLLGFASNEAASRTVSLVIAAGIIPAAMEMMDRPAIDAVAEFAGADYPRDVEALLIVELDGDAAEVDALCARVIDIATAGGAASCRRSNDEAERLAFWAGRKAAFAAVGRMSPDYLCMDGSIPRSKLAHVLARMKDLEQQFALRAVNVFHAGDGNLHPIVLFDSAKPGELERAEAFGAAILRLCVQVGGVLTGEHGVGVEKRDLMLEQFTAVDLAHQERLKCAFDPKGLLNPGKMFPVLHRCAELGRMHVHGGNMAFAGVPRF